MNHKRVVQCKYSLYDVYIGRPSKWGNPFSHLESEIAKFKVKDRLEAVQSYAYWIQEQEDLMNDLYELEGKVLGCFCVPNLCHGTVLAELADRLDPEFKSIEKEFTEQGDELVQAIYKYLFSIRKHLEIEGSTEFIDLVRNIVGHLNKNHEDYMIILKENISDQNIIKFRKN